jgi:hypothetical protein
MFDGPVCPESLMQMLEYLPVLRYLRNRSFSARVTVAN